MILDVPGRQDKRKFVVIRDLRFYCCVSKSKGTAIAEVELKDGLADATHIHSAPWTPDKAFLPDQPHAWINGENQRRLPAMVWIEFPANKAFIPGRISFRPRQDCCL